MPTKETKEARVRRKILQALGRKVFKGLPNVLRQPEINKIVGQSSIRAPYLKALLEQMQ